MVGIGKITRIAGVNSDSRTARQAGRDARQALHAIRVPAITEQPLGEASFTTFSPKAQAILASQKETSPPTAETPLTVVAASFGLVGYMGSRKLKKG